MHRNGHPELQPLLAELEDAFDIAADPEPGTLAELELDSEAAQISEARRLAAQAVGETIKLLKVAIASQTAGVPIPNVVFEAMSKYFTGTRENQIEELIARIEPMQRWILSFPVRRHKTHKDFADLLQKDVVKLAIKEGVPAVAFPVGKPGFGSAYLAEIALLPAWDTPGEEHLRATRLLHEAFHFAYLDVTHERNQRWHNAFAYQGLVSVLGGLPIGQKLINMF